jgi:hypothetical protein
MFFKRLHKFWLNKHIEKEECIKKHKNNQASGEDAIINEYIKATSD